MTARLRDPISIGVVASAHGVRGALRVKPVGDGRHLREGIAPLLGDERRPILSARPTPKGFLVELEGLRDRNEVEVLRGEPLLLDRSELDEPEEGEVYVADLVGLEAFDEAGTRLGTVAETFPTAAHEVLVVRRDDSPPLYVPFTLEHVPEVSVGEGRLVARPPKE